VKRLDIDLRFNRPQFEAFQVVAPRHAVFLGWGRGVGKSWFTRSIWWLKVAEWEHRQRPNYHEPLRGVRIVVLMPTLKQFKDVHWEGIERELGPGGQWEFLGAKLDRNTGQIHFPGGSWVKPFPASAYNSKVARGQRCDILCADEVDDIDPDVYYGVAIPCLSEPWSLGIELLGGTPTRGRHGLWWHLWRAGQLGQSLRDGTVAPEVALKSDTAQAIQSVFENLSEDDWPTGVPKGAAEATLFVLRGYYSFKATYKDAPETVSPLAVARARASTPEATFKREWEADPDAGEGLIYVFDEKFHVRAPPPGIVWTEILIGCDHGWEDPGVLLLIGVLGHGQDAICWVLEEVYEQHRDEDWWVAKTLAWTRLYPNHRFYGDPSMPSRIEAHRKRGRARVQEVDNSIQDGIAAVAKRMTIREDEKGERSSRFYVSPRCPNTIRELGLYRRKKRPDGSFSEEPEDKNNHTGDSFRYPIFNRFGPEGPSTRTFNRYDARS
jgi:hypothetical protein